MFLLRILPMADIDPSFTVVFVLANAARDGCGQIVVLRISTCTVDSCSYFSVQYLKRKISCNNEV